jgi:hypothetical protein
MFSLLLFVAMTQTQHDDAERVMQAELIAQRDQIADIWRPSKQLMADYQAAEKCYVKFHLGKAAGCSEQLGRVEVDLINEDR